jgi:hypothetical protein
MNYPVNLNKPQPLDNLPGVQAAAQALKDRMAALRAKRPVKAPKYMTEIVDGKFTVTSL